SICTPRFHNEEQLLALETAELSEPVTVWMKLDTGMHRLGVRPEQAEAFYQRLSHGKNVHQPVKYRQPFCPRRRAGMWCNGAGSSIFLITFCEGKPGMRSIAASGGIMLWPQSHFDWARPGIILYGVSITRWKTDPLGPRFWSAAGDVFGVEPESAVREHKAGEPVGLRWHVGERE
ncbi:alanine racemase, partial [Lelliottia amnigena]|uniref:alanine racemase n=1 Tax=Lelliottia amnigena TaxID=61646 RepID=UPI001FCFD45D